MFAFLYVKANSNQICDEKLMSAFLLGFKANYREKMLGYPHFSLWIPIAIAKIYFFPCCPNLAQKPLYLETEHRKADRTVGANCFVFPNISWRQRIGPCTHRFVKSPTRHTIRRHAMPYKILEILAPAVRSAFLCSVSSSL